MQDNLKVLKPPAKLKVYSMLCEPHFGLSCLLGSWYKFALQIEELLKKQ